MNWLTNFVRPKIQAWAEKKDVPEDLWHRCPRCERMIFHREMEENLYVCPSCSHHMRLPLATRLSLLMNPGSYQRLDIPKAPQDPLKFKDTKKYSDRLKDYRTKTQEQDGIMVVYGTMGSHSVVMAGMNFDFMGGSMGIAVGNGLVTAARKACDLHVPLIVLTASGGARMQEGIYSLMQMPRIVAAIRQVKEVGLPYLVLLTDPTTGGVSASFAMLGDVALAEPGAIIGFAGPRVIQETIRQKLPEGFQRSEYLLEHGMIDQVVHRKDLKATLVHILNHLHPHPKSRPELFSPYKDEEPLHSPG